MHIDLHERSVADGREAVHLAGLDDEDVTRSGFELHTIDDPDAATITDELDFIVGMDVRRRALAGFGREEKHGNTRVTVVGPDEVV